MHIDVLSNEISPDKSGEPECSRIIVQSENLRFSPRPISSSSAIATHHCGETCQLLFHYASGPAPGIVRSTMEVHRRHGSSTRSSLTRATQVPKARGAGRSGPRRRTGCLTCRARKVRCDESKPSCTSCDRLRLRCVYKAPIALGEWASSRSIDTDSTHAVSQSTPMPAMSPASATAIAAANATTAERSPDLNYFSTVLRSDDRHRTIPAPAPLPSGAEPYPPHLGGPFDMLGFMGGITSELEQKHLDLTSGLAVFPTSPMPQSGPDHTPFATDARSPLSPGATPSMVDGMSIGSASDAATTRGSWSDPGSMSYEEQLLQHFLVIDPPAPVFAPVAMEWKYVRPAVLLHARDFSPLLNALYCYSDIHKAGIEGKRWRWAPTYYRVASSEIQASLLGEVTEPTLIRVFTAVFFLMLSEVRFFS